MTDTPLAEGRIRGGWDEIDVLVAHTGMAEALVKELDGTGGVRLHTADAPHSVLRAVDVAVGHLFPPGSLSARPRLRWLHLTGTGTDHLPATGLALQALVTTSRSVPVTAVAEYAVSGLMYVLKGLGDLAARPERWFGSDAALLAGSTVAVVGAGRIGRAVLRMLRGTGAHTVAVTRSGRHSAVPEADWTVTADRLAEKAATIDHLVLCLPGGPDTRNLVDGSVLAALRPHAVLVNVGRAETVDDAALHEALRAGRLRGAFVDVHRREPLPDDDEAWRVPGLVVSPHRAFAFPEEPAKVAETFLANLHDLRSRRSPRDLVPWGAERTAR